MHTRKELDCQLSAMIVKHSMPKEWAIKLFAMLDTEENKANQSAGEAVLELREKSQDFSRNLARLTDVYVAQDIERNDYLERRHSLMSEKKSVEEQISRLLRTPSMWIEPTREWIKMLQYWMKLRKRMTSLQKTLPQKIFGSNLTLKNAKRPKCF